MKILSSDLRKSVALASAVCSVLAIAPRAGAATQGVASIVSSVVDTGSSSVHTVSTSTATNIQTTYNGLELRINSITATGGEIYVPTAAGVAIVRRNTGSSNFPNTNANITTAWNQTIQNDGSPATGTNPSGTPSSDSTRTVYGVYNNSMDDLYTSQNLRTGTENLFVNNGDSNNAASNVERVDYIFEDGVVISQDQGFAVFERNRNGNFKVALITSIDQNGTPTGFTDIVLTGTTTQYGPALTEGLGGPGSMRYDVYRSGSDSPSAELSFMVNANIGPQTIGGILFSSLDFGLSTGTTFYGYAVFGVDVTATGANLVDWDNATYFPQNSPLSNDMDLITSGASIFAVPEPTSAVLALTAGLGLMLRSRRRSS